MSAAGDPAAAAASGRLAAVLMSPPAALAGSAQATGGAVLVVGEPAPAVSDQLSALARFRTFLHGALADGEDASILASPIEQLGHVYLISVSCSNVWLLGLYWFKCRQVGTVRTTHKKVDYNCPALACEDAHEPYNLFVPMPHELAEGAVPPQVTFTGIFPNEQGKGV